MRKSVFINGQTHHLSRKNLVGAGGEAEIYKINNGDVLKVYKTPDHPDYENEPSEQEGARRRLKEHQMKLPAFPRSHPGGLVGPKDLAYDRKGGDVCGFTMPFITDSSMMCEWNEANYRKQHAIDFPKISEMLTRLWHLVQKTHEAGIIIGDFNWMNVMVNNQTREPMLIDADSMQFGTFLCTTYTETFVDPALCDPNKNRPILIKPHDELSDWYAFTVQCCMLLLRTDPFGGVYKPTNNSNRIPHTARPLKRITVFDDEVKYPKPAEPRERIPKELLEHFLSVFKEGKRLVFPADLIGNIDWTKLKVLRIAVVTTKITGKVTFSMVSETNEYIIHATTQGGKLLLIKGHQGTFVREDGSRIIQTHHTDIRFRILGTETYYAHGSSLVNNNGLHIHVDNYRDKLPMFDTNSKRLFWISGGCLYRQKNDRLGQFNQEHIGDVVENQTLFWVGEQFGCGFYKAGEIQGAFVFNEASGKINDGVKLPKVKGEVVDSTCVFAKDICWLLVSMYTGKTTDNWCFCIHSNGEILGQAKQEAGTPGWLSQIRGKTAAANFLLCATDEGIMRCGIQKNNIIEEKLFEDTETYVDSESHLLPGPGGLYVVGPHKVGLLKIG